MKTEKIEQKKEFDGTINGVSGFIENPRYENCYIYTGMSPLARCWVFCIGDEVEIHNVIVHESNNRRKGIGREMIRAIRNAFPNKTIWVDTWNCSRGFWEKMVDEGFIDEIENEHNWPCFNTSCMTCHPVRNDNRRRCYF